MVAVGGRAQAAGGVEPGVSRPDSTPLPPLTLYWRGPLDGCTYACPYCPFAKRAYTPANLDADRAALARFVAWVAEADRAVDVLMTPWGESLVFPWTQAALCTLSHMPHVRCAGTQSNASGPTRWAAAANPDRLSLWLTWHPGEVSAAEFLAKVCAYRDLGVRVSAGVVAQPEHLDAAEALFASLPEGAKGWVNAAKPPRAQPEAHHERWARLDPNYPLDRRGVRSRGLLCATGETTFLVEGEGTVRRCHLLAEPLGNLYEGALERLVTPRACPRARCDCYVGYSQLTPMRTAAEAAPASPELERGP